MASLPPSPAEQARRWVDDAWGERQGLFCFAFGVGGHFNERGKYDFERWLDRSGRWPDDRDRFLAEALEESAECDVYVAPYLRSTPNRKKGNALPSDLVYADVDDLLDELRGFERLLLGPGGFLVSSGGGLHAYLRLPEDLEPAELEEWNRRLAARLKADAGWAENKVLRLPGTWNHKERARGGRSAPVEFVEFEPAPHDTTAGWSRRTRTTAIACGQPERVRVCATMSTLDETQLLTVGEVAQRLRQSERTVRDKIASGSLPAIRIGDGPRAPIRVESDELDAWLHAGSRRPAEGATEIVGDVALRRAEDSHAA